MPLSAGNVIQAKTANAVNQQTISVTLDNPTTPGGTVTVEMLGPAVYPSMPAGWDFDGLVPSSAPVQWTFHYCGGPGGETSWSWTYVAATHWLWRVTEWDVGLDPVSPLEVWAEGDNLGGTGVTTVSSGTTPATNRGDVVALAMHSWFSNRTSAQAFNWDSYTNGFTERDELRVTMSPTEYDTAWSWKFGTTPGATYETTATVNTTPRDALDTYRAHVVVYAATVPVEVPPGVLAAGGAP